MKTKKNKKMFCLIFYLVFYIQIYGQTDNTLNAIVNAKNNLETSEKKASELSSSYNDLKKDNEKLQKRNDSIIKAIGIQTLNTQKVLYKNNYEILLSNLKEIDNLEKQIKEYQNSYKIALSGTTIATLISPTSNALGASFTDIIATNSKSILTDELNDGKKTKFSNIIDKIVSPLVSSVLTSNPIGSIINNVLQQALTFDDGKIKQEKLDKFIISLKPHIEFYEKFDREVTDYETKLIIYGNDINSQYRKLKNYRKNLYKTLEIADADNAYQKIEELFKIQNENLNINDLRGINNSIKVIDAKKLIEKMPDFDIDKNSFTDSYNNYISKIINILNNSSSNTNLKFDSYKLSKVVDKLETSKIDNN
ncbi:hypothetical protein [Chryseobacterium culicis]|uniref:Uncharacterized protein n=1 Tax=Chryseobacterium culicis TaxID=680127 RepID=A0A1H6GY40_CHRCI|nr:hypothetical protein [Chryseobacterium culicis]SEH27792.1 hypothetical protein SAMN05421593_0490 [Chryseobacterium culicis]